MPLFPTGVDNKAKACGPRKVTKLALYGPVCAGADESWRLGGRGIQGWEFNSVCV